MFTELWVLEIYQINLVPIVIPAQAGIQKSYLDTTQFHWIPVYAGMTG